jgi:hypothetical protein
MTLEKAALLNAECYSNQKDPRHIIFMFNPTMISFSRSMNTEPSKGSRDHKGDSNVSFKSPNPYTVQIANIMLDTYEKRTSVLDAIEKFKDGVQFVNGSHSSGKQGKDQRPPIYFLFWGGTYYLQCFIKSLNFKLTMFLSNGTPVRATVDLTLEQVNIPIPQRNQTTRNPSKAMRKQGRPDISGKEEKPPSPPKLFMT